MIDFLHVMAANRRQARTIGRLRRQNDAQQHLLYVQADMIASLRSDVELVAASVPADMRPLVLALVRDRHRIESLEEVAE